MLVQVHFGHGGERRGGEHLLSLGKRCLQVLSYASQEWSAYLRYGSFSWKRIPDGVGRRDIGLMLVVNILRYDRKVFNVGVPHQLSSRRR